MSAADALAEKVAAGVVWVTASHLGLRAIGLIRGVVLARLLAPEDFGLFSLASAVIGCLGAVRDAGAGAYLIRAHGDEHRQAGAAFWYTLAVAIVLAGGALLMAPLLGLAYASPRLPLLISSLALGSVLEAAGLTHLALSSKRLRFRARTSIALLANLIALATAVALAALGAGAWALVGASLVAGGASTLLAWRLVAWRPPRRLELALWPDIWRLGSRLLAAELVWYALTSADGLVVGKLLGADALGLYVVAGSYALALPGLIGFVLHEVRFPVLASLRLDPIRLRRAYLSSLRLSLAAGMAVGLGLYLVGPVLFELVLGPRWAPAVVPFRILLLGGLMRHLLPDLAYALGRPDLELRIGLVWLAVLAVGLGLGVTWGLASVAWAVSGTLAGYWLTSHIVAGRLVGAGPAELARSLLPAAAGRG